MFKIVVTEDGTTKIYNKETGKLTYLLKPKQNSNVKENYRKGEEKLCKKDEMVSPKHLKTEQISEISNSSEELQTFQKIVTHGRSRKRKVSNTTMMNKNQSEETVKENYRKGEGKLCKNDEMVSPKHLKTEQTNEISNSSEELQTFQKIVTHGRPRNRKVSNTTMTNKNQSVKTVVVKVSELDNSSKKVPNAYYDADAQESGSEETDPYKFEIYDGITGNLKAVDILRNPKKCVKPKPHKNIENSCIKSSDIHVQQKKQKKKYVPNSRGHKNI